MAQAYWDPRNFRKAALSSLICLFLLYLLPTELSQHVQSSLSRVLYPDIGELRILAYQPTFHVGNIPVKYPVYNEDGSYSHHNRMNPVTWLYFFSYAAIKAMIPSSLTWIWVPIHRYGQYSWHRPESTQILLELLQEMMSGFQGVLILANCVMILFLSTYYTTKRRDVYMPFKFHFKYGHTQGDNDNNRHREKEYWGRLNSSLKARNQLEAFWAARIAAFFFVVYFAGPGGALACLLQHILNLGFAIFRTGKSAEKESAAAHSAHKFTSLVAFFVSGIYAAPGVFYPLQWLLSEFYRQSNRLTWMNELPCILCDEVKPDIKVEEIHHAATTLGRFQEEICRHCWGPWQADERIVVLRCGHIYHYGCCDEWFRTTGRRQCPVCRFEVSENDYRRASRRRRIYAREEINRKIALVDPRGWWVGGEGDRPN